MLRRAYDGSGRSGCREPLSSGGTTTGNRPPATALPKAIEGTGTLADYEARLKGLTAPAPDEAKSNA
jgi:hypothetical protein